MKKIWFLNGIVFLSAFLLSDFVASGFADSVFGGGVSAAGGVVDSCAEEKYEIDKKIGNRNFGSIWISLGILQTKKIHDAKIKHLKQTSVESGFIAT